MYNIFVALAIGLILLNWAWQLFRNYGLAAGLEAEDPVKLSIRSVLFILLAYFSAEIVSTILKIGGTPYQLSLIHILIHKSSRASISEQRPWLRSSLAIDTGRKKKPLSLEQGAL